ncbi:MAG: hypothetical protein QME74_01000, partial [Candidatus Edwardsbacteria bacterium]|nr:hypothetical protein [Candidatus Edwardsbacteria bacterium]
YETIAGFNLSDDLECNYAIIPGSSIYLYAPKPTWKDALDSIGKSFKDFRSKVAGKVSDTPNFGFPIWHRSTKCHMGANKPGSDKKTFLGRSASPLIFKVVEAGGKYYPAIVFLNTKLCPDEFKIMDDTGGNVGEVDNNILFDFIDESHFSEEIKI